MNESSNEPSKPVSHGDNPGLPETFGRYRIQRLLGRGAMGAVYLAQDTQLSRLVAIKVPHFRNDQTDELLQRFYREARSAATLRNPNICPVYDVGEIDGQHFISMAYIEGQSLSEVIKANGQLPERQALLLVRKLALALQEAHDNGIIHRDLKPANVMIDAKGEPVVMDFGLAYQARENAARLTHSGVILGSPAYMSPQQLEGDSNKVTPAADQYALGVILYELLIGEMPFRGSVTAVIKQIISNSAPSPRLRRPEIDPRVDELCLRMLSKHPEDRFESMKEVADRIVTILKGPANADKDNATPAEEVNNPVVSKISPTPETASSNAAQLQDQVAELVKLGKLQTALKVLEPLKKSKNGELAEWAGRQFSEIREQIEVRRKGVSTLCQVAAKLIRKHDYAEAMNVLSSVPIGERTEELDELLADAEAKEEEANLLLKDIEKAIRKDQPKDLPILVKRFLQLKPGNKAIQAMLAELKQHGPEHVIRLRRGQRDFLDPAGPLFSPLQLTCFAGGLLLFCVALYVGVVGFQKHSGTVIVTVNDPRLTLFLAKDSIKVSTSGKSFRLTTTEKRKLKAEIDGATVAASIQEIHVEKNETKLISASLIDGKLDLQIRSDKHVFASPDKTKEIGNEPVTSNNVARKTPAQGPEKIPDGWTDLLNQNDLIGWEGDKSYWSITNGILSSRVETLEKPAYLLTEMEYSNFELRLQFRLMNEGGSGVQYRTVRNASGEQPLVTGHQVEIGFVTHSGENAKNVVGDVFGTGMIQSEIAVAQPVQRTAINEVYRHRDWNQLVIRCDGPREVIELNGVTTSEIYNVKAPKSGRIGFQLFDAKVPQIEFRNVWIHPNSGKSKASPGAIPQTPDNTVSKAPDSPTVLLDVDFRKSDGGFFGFENSDVFFREHKNGEYTYHAKQQGYWFHWLHPVFQQKENNQIRDFSMEIDLRLVGHKKGAFAIKFGLAGAHQYDVTCNQTGELGLRLGFEDVVPPTPSKAVRQIEQFNTLRLTVQNKTVNVSVNGSPVFEKRLERYSGNTVSLWLHPEETPFDVRFQRIRFEIPANVKKPNFSGVVRRLIGHTNAIRGVAFLPDSRRAISVGHDKAFKLWDVTTGSLLHDFAGHTANVTSVSLSGDGRLALTGCDDGLIRMWDLENRIELKKIPKKHSEPVIGVLLSNNGKAGLSTSLDGTIRQWEFKTLVQSSLLSNLATNSFLAVSHDENMIACGNNDGTIALFNPRNRQVTATWSGHQPGEIKCLAFTPDDSKLVTGSDDGTVRVWDLKTGKKADPFETEGAGIVSVAVTSDGRYIIAGSRDHSIVRFDLHTGKSEVLIHAEMPVTGRLSLSPDNQWVLSGASDDRAWDYDLHLWRLPNPVVP